jgi:hypothetical protein
LRFFTSVPSKEQAEARVNPAGSNHQGKSEPGEGVQASSLAGKGTIGRGVTVEAETDVTVWTTMVVGKTAATERVCVAVGNAVK